MDSSGYYEKDKRVTIDGVTYKFDKNGYVEQFTEISFYSSKKAQIEYDINIDEEGKYKEFIRELLGYYICLETDECIIDGKKYTVSEDENNMYIGKKELNKFLSSLSNQTKICFELNDLKFFDNWAVASSFTDYKVIIGGVTFSDIISYGDMYEFKVNGKKYIEYSLYGDVDNKLKIEGDVRNEDWVKSLKEQGLITVSKDLVY